MNGVIITWKVSLFLFIPKLCE